jgi:hypothetical protein
MSTTHRATARSDAPVRARWRPSSSSGPRWRRNRASTGPRRPPTPPGSASSTPPPPAVWPSASRRRDGRAALGRRQPLLAGQPRPAWRWTSAAPGLALEVGPESFTTVAATPGARRGGRPGPARRLPRAARPAQPHRPQPDPACPGRNGRGGGRAPGGHDALAVAQATTGLLITDGDEVLCTLEPREYDAASPRRRRLRGSGWVPCRGREHRRRLSGAYHRMVFTSTVFLFLFLPAFLTVYALLPPRAARRRSSSAPTPSTPGGAPTSRSCSRSRRSSRSRPGGRWRAAAADRRRAPRARMGRRAQLATLAYFKYAGFGVESLNALLRPSGCARCRCSRSCCRSASRSTCSRRSATWPTSRAATRRTTRARWTSPPTSRSSPS